MSDSVTPCPPGSSVPGILQARILEWVAISFSRKSSQPRDWICVSCTFCITADSLPSEPLGKSQESSLAPQFESIFSLALSFLYGPTCTSIHDYWKNHSLTLQTFVGKVMSLIFNMLSRFVIALLPRRKSLNFMATVTIHGDILQPRKTKSALVYGVP